MIDQNISGRPLTFKEKFLIWFVPFLIANLQRLYGLTLRRIDVGRESLNDLKKRNKAWIYAIWHTNVFFSPYLNRGQNVNVMISASRDGELIYGVVRRFKNRAIRGSTSRGGMKALKTLIDELKKGLPAAITPDGPRGPAFRLQQGIITAAMRSGAPIIPFHYEANRQWIFKKSWDQHRIPKPFSTVVVFYGNPIYIKSDLSAEEFEKVSKEVEEGLLENMRNCQNYVKSLYES